MEKFSKLSIDDELDKTIKEEDLIRLSNLNISDEVGRVPSQIFTRFMPHSPVCPSPLRYAVKLDQLDLLDDKMEVDEDANGLVKEFDNITIEKNQEGSMGGEEQYVPSSLSIEQKEEKDLRAHDHSTNRTYELDTKEEVSELDESDIKEEEEKLHKGTVIKALLSPTSLGVATAAKIDGVPIDQSIQTPESLLKGNCHSEATGVDFTNLKDELRWRSKTQPIHVFVNHHHYYSGMNGQRPFMQDLPRTAELDCPSSPYSLPVPWSSNSNPVSKNAYIFASYLQLFLNFITVVVIFSFVLSLVRSLKTDIISTWNHRRLELEYESINCKNSFIINDCTLGNKPALHDQCQKWERCMSRDNNLFFRARTTLGAHLFGEVINSFVEPIGWKALIVVLLGSTIWCFSSNFLLGYMRAKSYYGDAAKQYQRQQGNQLFLKDEDRANRELS